MKEEQDILQQFIRGKNLKLTEQRELILKEFLATEDHVSVDDLYLRVNARHPSIGHATVFRTMKLLKEADLAREVDVGDKRIRYEHAFGHRHHDHLICRRCGKIIEVFDDKIEQLQDKLCRDRGFLADHHRLEIFGLCSGCRKKKG